MVKAEQSKQEEKRLSIGRSKEEGRRKEGKVEYSAIGPLRIKIFLHQPIQHSQHPQTCHVRDNQPRKKRIMRHNHQTPLQQGIERKEDRLPPLLIPMHRYGIILVRIPM